VHAAAITSGSKWSTPSPWTAAGQRRELRVGAYPSALATFLHVALAALVEDRPETIVTVEQAPEDELRFAGRTGRLHLAVLFQDPTLDGEWSRARAGWSCGRSRWWRLARAPTPSPDERRSICASSSPRSGRRRRRTESWPGPARRRDSRRTSAWWFAARWRSGTRRQRAGGGSGAAIDGANEPNQPWRPTSTRAWTKSAHRRSRTTRMASSRIGRRIGGDTPCRGSPDLPEPLRQSGRLDLNQRPLGPQPSALPDCATPRRWRDDSVP
jgi:hypothetical protein